MSEEEFKTNLASTNKSDTSDLPPLKSNTNITTTTPPNINDQPSLLTSTNSSINISSLNSNTNKILKPKKKSKKLCQYKQCLNTFSIIGDCQFCFKKFCTKHRLLESHDCDHYRDVQKDYHDRNAKQLQAQQTVVSKV